MNWFRRDAKPPAVPLQPAALARDASAVGPATDPERFAAAGRLAHQQLASSGVMRVEVTATNKAPAAITGLRVTLDPAEHHDLKVYVSTDDILRRAPLDPEKIAADLVRAIEQGLAEPLTALRHLTARKNLENAVSEAVRGLADELKLQFGRADIRHLEFGVSLERVEILDQSNERHSVLARVDGLDRGRVALPVAALVPMVQEKIRQHFAKAKRAVELRKSIETGIGAALQARGAKLTEQVVIQDVDGVRRVTARAELASGQRDLIWLDVLVSRGIHGDIPLSAVAEDIRTRLERHFLHLDQVPPPGLNPVEAAVHKSLPRIALVGRQPPNVKLEGPGEPIVVRDSSEHLTVLNAMMMDAVPDASPIDLSRALASGGMRVVLEPGVVATLLGELAQAPADRNADCGMAAHQLVQSVRLRTSSMSGLTSHLNSISRALLEEHAIRWEQLLRPFAPAGENAAARRERFASARSASIDEALLAPGQPFIAPEETYQGRVIPEHDVPSPGDHPGMSRLGPALFPDGSDRHPSPRDYYAIWVADDRRSLTFEPLQILREHAGQRLTYDHVFDVEDPQGSGKQVTLRGSDGEPLAIERVAWMEGTVAGLLPNEAARDLLTGARIWEEVPQRFFAVEVADPTVPPFYFVLGEYGSIAAIGRNASLLQSRHDPSFAVW